MILFSIHLYNDIIGIISSHALQYVIIIFYLNYCNYHEYQFAACACDVSILL